MGLLEELLDVFHEFVVVERNAYCVLQFFKLKLLKKQVVALLRRDLFLLACYWYRPHDFYHQTTGEIAADKAEHLMIVEGRDRFVIGS